ncbi:MAG: carboxypeptidase-like regulatory domain-containing protein [Acidobacteriota bacterium]
MRSFVHLISLLVLTLASALGQQSRGTILGTVMDSSGAAAPGAVMVITNVGTNATFRTESGAEGFYTAPGLPVGKYSVTAELAGFKKAVRAGVTLEVDQRARVDFTLELGAVTESVEVVGATPLVDTASATLGKVVENRRMSDLPVNGRNAFALMLIAPGVKPTTGPTYSGFTNRGTHLGQGECQRRPEFAQ